MFELEPSVQIPPSHADSSDPTHPDPHTHIHIYHHKTQTHTHAPLLSLSFRLRVLSSSPALYPSFTSHPSFSSPSSPSCCRCAAHSCEGSCRAM